jgi:hypothetical protein
METTKEAIARRTNAILKQNRGNKNEWTRLHVILCMSHGWEDDESIELRTIIDLQAIATRLDEMDGRL